MSFCKRAKCSTAVNFHPEALLDLDIWEFIRADNLDAADLLPAESRTKSRYGLSPSCTQSSKAGS